MSNINQTGKIQIEKPEAIYSEFILEQLIYFCTESERCEMYSNMIDIAKQNNIYNDFKEKLDYFMLAHSSYIQENNIELWEKPSPLKQEKKLPEFPIYCLPEMLQEWCKNVSEFSQTSQDMSAMSLLSCLSLCLQGKFKVRYLDTDHTENINLYMLTIASPGERKSSVYSKFMDPVYEYQNEENERRRIEIARYNDEMELLESRIRKLKKDGKSSPEQIDNIRQEQLAIEPVYALTLNLTDTTSEALSSAMMENKERMGLIADEGGVFDVMAGRYSGNIPNIDIYLNSYDGKFTSILRRATRVTLSEPLLTIGMLVQPDVLSNMMQNEAFLGRGFIQRFLFAFPYSRVGTRELKGKPLDENLKNGYKKLIYKLLNIKNNGNCETLSLSQKACWVFEPFFERIERNLKLGGDLRETKYLAEWGSKMCGKVLRIAALLHLCENDSNAEIAENTMIKAMKIGEYFIEHGKYAFLTMLNDALISDTEYVLEKIKTSNQKCISQRDLLRTCRKFNKLSELTPIIEHLAENNYIKCEDQPNSSGLIKINPILL